MTAQSEPYLTPEEYLALEREAETKSEYWDGRIYSLAGASHAHTLIAANVTALLVNALRSRPCTVHVVDQRVKVAAAELCTYPDIVVVCGKAQFEDDRCDTLLNPAVLFEILSPSTEIYDRGAKFEFYRVLDSLTDYVLVSQDHPLMEHYARRPDGKWLLSAHSGLDVVARIDSIGCDLSLRDVFAKAEWPPPEEVGPLRRIKEKRVAYPHP